MAEAAGTQQCGRRIRRIRMRFSLTADRTPPIGGAFEWSKWV
jgi:hypothetical protein